MQIAGKTVLHVERWHDVMDGSSRNACRQIIEHALKDHRRVEDEIEEGPDKDFFVETFADDVKRAEDALALVTP